MPTSEDVDNSASGILYCSLIALAVAHAMHLRMRIYTILPLDTIIL